MAGRRTTVLVVAEGLRGDHVRPERMPFLHALSRQGAQATLAPPPGFAPWTVLMTGCHPDTTGHLGAFVYDPLHSPFRWVRRMGPLRAAVRPRRLLAPARWGVRRVTRWASPATAGDADPAWIPARDLHRFRPCDVLLAGPSPGFGAGSPVPTLPELCRRNGLRVVDLTRAGSGGSRSGPDAQREAALVRAIRSGAPADLCLLRLGGVDRAGHRGGPFGPQVDAALRSVDEALARIHAALCASREAWDLVVCGDHGMTAVRQRIDVQAALAGLDARPGRDYVALVHSTWVSFWFLTMRGQAAIDAALAGIPGARVLDGAQRRLLRVPTDRGWGDRVLAAREGAVFWPDHFHVAEGPAQGMHGYLEPVAEGHPPLVVAGSGSQAPRNLGRRRLVDVFPTLCDLLGIPIPVEQEGTSLLPTRAKAARPVRAAAGEPPRALRPIRPLSRVVARVARR